MWSVIPVAGLGTRLDDLKRGHSKALLEIGGRTIIDRLLQNVAEVASDVCLVVGRDGAGIRAAVGDTAHGARIHYVTQPRPAGVGDAVLRAAGLARGPVMVVMGDCYFEDPLESWVRAWKRVGSDGAVLVEPIRTPVRGPVGLVKLHRDRVVAIAKANYRGQADHQVCGSMILPEGALESAEREFARRSAGELELEDIVARMLAHRAHFVAIDYRGWRRNINTPDDLHEVERRIEETAQATLS